MSDIRLTRTSAFRDLRAEFEADMDGFDARLLAGYREPGDGDWLWQDRVCAGLTNRDVCIVLLSMGVQPTPAAVEAFVDDYGDEMDRALQDSAYDLAGDYAARSLALEAGCPGSGEKVRAALLDEATMGATLVFDVSGRDPAEEPDAFDGLVAGLHDAMCDAAARALGDRDAARDERER